MIMRGLGTSLTKCTQVPQAIINRSDFASVLGVADLGQEKWRRHLRKTVAEAKNEPASNVH